MSLDGEQYRQEGERGDITIESWTKDNPKPDWLSHGGTGPEPDWHKIAQKVVSNADYSGSTVPAGVSFAGLKLVNANFKGATFKGKVNFQCAKFEGTTTFTKATFVGDSSSWAANFWGAKFFGITSFEKATFKCKAMFDYSSFVLEVTFRCTIFNQHVKFSCSDLGPALFTAAKFNRGFEMTETTNLSQAKLIDTATFAHVVVDNIESFTAKASASVPVPVATGSKSDGATSLETFGGFSEDAGVKTVPKAQTDGYDKISESWVSKRQIAAMMVDADTLARHKREIEFTISRLLNVRAFLLSKDNWSGFLVTIQGLYDFMESLMQNGGSRKAIDVLGKIIFCTKPAPNSSPDSSDYASKWQTPRATFLTVVAIKDGFSLDPPSPGVLAAMDRGITAPFHRVDFLTQLADLKQELAYIAEIEVAKDRVGLLLSQVSLSLLFGVASIVASYIYDEEQLHKQQTLINQQEIIVLLRAILNTSTTGN